MTRASSRLTLVAALATLPLAACSQTSRLAAACDAGDPAACEDLSARYLAGDGVVEDSNRAAELDTRALDLCSKAENAAKPACKLIARRPQTIPLELPKAAPSTETHTVLSVVVPASGTIFVDGVAVEDDSALLASARAAAAKSPDVRAVIKADAATTHGRVIHVLDLLKQAGISKIAFGVEPVQPLPPIPATSAH